MNILVLTVGALNPGSTLIVNEIPSGAVPGTTYALSQSVGSLLGFYINGLLQRPGTDYTVSGQTVTTTFATSVGDNVYAVYMRGT